MVWAPFYRFEFPDGYVARYTTETVERLRNRKRGRPALRFNIFKLDSFSNIAVIPNITFGQLKLYRAMAEEQGNKIW